MAEIIRCRCGQRYQIKSGFTRKHVKCRECGKQLSIPRAEDELPVITEVLEEHEDFDEFEEEEVARPVGSRKSRSRKKSKNWGLQIALQILAQFWRFAVRIVMTFWAIITIISSSVAFPLLFSLPVWFMCAMGLAGVNGRGIAVSRDYRLEGDRAIVLGSILIVVASSLPAFWAIAILGRR